MKLSFERKIIMKSKDFLNKLSNERAWGVSSKSKIPLFTTDYLYTGNLANLRPVNRNDMDNLPTLGELDNNYSLALTNRAYHLHAKDNLIVAFDVEVRSDPSYIQAFINQPSPYKEWSKHKGVHLFYELDRTRLTAKALEVLSERVEYKFKDNYQGKALEFELIMNKHWLTVTRNFIDENIENTTPQWVYDLINKTSEDYQQATDLKIDIGAQASETAKMIAENLTDAETLHELYNLTVSDFNDDDSKYEFNVALRLIKMFRDRINNFNFVDAMNFENRILHDKDIIWATALLLKDIVPARSKHNQTRQGMPFLVYEAKKANDWYYSHL